MKGKNKRALLTLGIGARDLYLRISRKTNFDTIFFEGGLGSQILCYIDFLKKPRDIDLSYFENPPKLRKDGPDVWKWELDRYGISIENLQSYKRDRLFNSWKERRPSTLELATRILKCEDQSESLSTDDIIRNFPLDKKALSKVKDLYDIDFENLTVVHVRRGDYERVASKLVSFSEYKTILKAIGHYVTQDVVFLSDEPLSSEIINELSEDIRQARTINLSSNELSSGLAHDLMRCSKVLITANSTFSISAGLLSSDRTLVFTPLMFFGGENGYIESRVFNHRGDFIVLNK